jgi:hypothetical protein
MSDIILDENSEQVTVFCNNLNVQGHDLLLDSAARRKPNGPTFRRALVHDENDGLTMNFNDDYPGGVTLNGVTSITPHSEPRGTGNAQIFRPDPTLVVNGDISYHVPSEVLVGTDPSLQPVLLSAEMSKIQAQLLALANRIKALEAKS